MEKPWIWGVRKVKKLSSFLSIDERKEPKEKRRG